MYIFEKRYCLDKKPGVGDVFRVLEDVSVLHCNELGFGGDVVNPRGVIWVVVRQKISVNRYPAAGEEFVVKTWPGPTRHMMFPRHYIVETAAGEQLLTGCAIWTLVDIQSRKMVSGEGCGVEIEGLVTGNEMPAPRAPRKLPVEHSREFTVPEEYLDTNGHMNNTHYYDLAENCLREETGQAEISEAVTEFIAEALQGEKMTVGYGREENRFYVSGDSSSPVFKMSLTYRI